MLQGIGSLTAYNVIKRSGQALTERYTSQKSVQRNVEDFRDRMSRITSAEELMKDRKALEFVLSSFQLDSEIGKTGIIRKLLTEDPTDDKSLAKRLADPRYGQLANAFSDWSKPPGQNKALMDKVINDNLTVQFERDQGRDNPGLQEALYFLRNIGKIETIPQLMSDRAMLYVAREGLGLPDQFTMLSYEQQRNMFVKRIDLEKLKDPAETEKFIQRFLINVGNKSGGTTIGGAAGAALTILGGGGGDITSLLGQNINLRI